MAGTLVIYRGLPGSGKTTKALEFSGAYGGRLAGRDHFRKLLGFSGVGTGKQEQEVTELQERVILSGLRAGQDVHVDDMNLRDKYVKRLIALAHSVDAGYWVHDLTDVDLNTCLARNAGRVAQVPSDVIRDLHARFIKDKGYPLPVPSDPFYDLQRVAPELYVPDPTKPAVALVDLDGTVALHEGIRGHHDYDKVSMDLPNPAVIKIVRSLGYTNVRPLFVSGRPDSCEYHTRLWIQRHVGLGGVRLFMRKTGDHRPDYIVKLEIFNEQIRNNFDVKFCLDDRDQVVRMYRELGLTVLQVAPGNF